MYFCILLFICAAVTGTHVKGPSRQQSAGSLPAASDNGNVHKGHARTKRTFFTIALRATKSLLKKAKPVPSTYKKMREFEKPGTYGTAMKDFESIDPVNVREFELPNQGKGLYGQIGDRIIMIQNKDIYSGKPILRIITELPFNEFRVNQITYMD